MFTVRNDKPPPRGVGAKSIWGPDRKPRELGSPPKTCGDLRFATKNWTPDNDVLGPSPFAKGYSREGRLSAGGTGRYATECPKILAFLREIW